jgi:sugar phosphate isomerase/epimerase
MVQETCQYLREETMTNTTRRQALAWGSAFLGAAVTGGCADAQVENLPSAEKVPEPVGGSTPELFKISLAQWSLHKALFADKNDPNHLPALMFPAKARRDFDIGAVEYVNSFYRDVVRNQSYLNQLKNVADNEGVISLLIMCDGEGQLGDPDPQARTQSIENHYKWADMAAHLGCKSIRVNAFSSGSFEDQQAYAADGLVRLAEYTRQFDMSVIVENHGGWSSHGAWLAGVMKRANNEYVGTLPDFGNFRYGDGASYDPYLGVEELMPYAHGVSAKSFGFDAEGNERGLDYERLLRIILDAGFRGYIGIEYEGNQLSEREGIVKTKQLLERLRAELAPEYS